MRRAAWPLGLLLLVPSCGGTLDSEDDIAMDEEAVLRTNGIKLNGIKLNGIKLNGIKLNGIKLNGVLLNGIKLNGTALYGVKPDRSVVSGFGFKGTTLAGLRADGSTLSLRITNIEPASDPELLFYTVEYYSGSAWQNLCGTCAKAIPFTGRWDEREGVTGGGSFINDSSLITFACRASAIAKCAEWGYKPWKTVSGVSLRNYHQACTRMVRADYCGNGQSFTAEGTAIDIYDRLGLQTDTAQTSGLCQFADAEWGPSGAVCMNSWRVAHPTCASSIPEYLDCAKTGKPWLASALLRNEFVFNAQWVGTNQVCQLNNQYTTPGGMNNASNSATFN